MSFIEYLIDNGYKPFRKVYDKQKKQYEYIEDNNLNYFSSMVPGYVDIRLIKDDSEIIWGLNEAQHSPTLIWPRLKDWVQDSDVDRVFKDLTYHQIFKLITNIT